MSYSELASDPEARNGCDAVEAERCKLILSIHVICKIVRLLRLHLRCVDVGRRCRLGAADGQAAAPAARYRRPARAREDAAPPARAPVPRGRGGRGRRRRGLRRHRRGPAARGVAQGERRRRPADPGLGRLLRAPGAGLPPPERPRAHLRRGRRGRRVFGALGSTRLDATARRASDHHEEGVAALAAAHVEGRAGPQVTGLLDQAGVDPPAPDRALLGVPLVPGAGAPRALLVVLAAVALLSLIHI